MPRQKNHHEDIARLERKIDVALNTLFHIYLKGLKTMALLDQIILEVEENKSAIDSAIVLIKALKVKLDEAGTDPVKLAELSNALDAQSKALAQAVVDNTPAVA